MDGVPPQGSDGADRHPTENHPQPPFGIAPGESGGEAGQEDKPPGGAYLEKHHEGLVQSESGKAAVDVQVVSEMKEDHKDHAQPPQGIQSPDTGGAWKELRAVRLFFQ